MVNDTACALFCDAFGFSDLKRDERLRSNNDRVKASGWMPLLREWLANCSAADLSAVFEKNALLFAPITRSEDLLDGPHLNVTGGLVPMILPDGSATKTALRHS